MSRHGFFKVLAEPTPDQHELEDLVGYGLNDWLNFGVAGYDPQLQTFFFNLDGSWIFGIEHGELPDISSLQAVLSAIFRGAELPFNEAGLLAIAQEVEPSPTILAPAQASVLSESVSNEYLEARVHLAQYYREQPDAALCEPPATSDLPQALSTPGAGSSEESAPEPGMVKKAFGILKRYL